jgi:hypothetical protein
MAAILALSLLTSSRGSLVLPKTLLCALLKGKSDDERKVRLGFIGHLVFPFPDRVAVRAVIGSSMHKYRLFARMFLQPPDRTALDHLKAKIFRATA